jgi:glycine C-acetyltransferase
MIEFRKDEVSVSRDFAEELLGLEEQCLLRKTLCIAGKQQTHVTVEGREVLLLCSNNYLGLADHPALRDAAVRAVEMYGVGSGASRLVSGTMELHEALERRIADFKLTERALVFNSGYAANTGVLPAIAGKGDIIFSDRLNHASIVDGSILSRARFLRYPHNDMTVLAKLLEEHQGNGGRRIIVTDGVFSMDGDMAPLAELIALKKEFDAILMVDDAHATGVLGHTGRGTAEHFGITSGIDIHMGTLGKALGSFGAFVAANEEIITYLLNRCRSFIYSTSLPPVVLAAAMTALEIIDSPEGMNLRRSLRKNAAFFIASLQRAGFSVPGSGTHIVPLLVGDANTTMEFSRLLFEQGIFVQGIRPPTVPVGSSRLRFTLMATHEENDLEKAAAIVSSVGKKLGIV